MSEPEPSIRLEYRGCLPADHKNRFTAAGLSGGTDPRPELRQVFARDSVSKVFKFRVLTGREEGGIWPGACTLGG